MYIFSPSIQIEYLFLWLRMYCESRRSRVNCLGVVVIIISRDIRVISMVIVVLVGVISGSPVVDTKQRVAALRLRLDLTELGFRCVYLWSLILLAIRLILLLLHSLRVKSSYLLLLTQNMLG